MPKTITLPDWMIHRIVAILASHPYTGATEIIQSIKEQVEKEEQ